MKWRRFGPRMQVMGPPASASRPRVGRRGTHYGKAHSAWEAKAVQVLGLLWGEAQITRPVKLEIDAVFRRPQSKTPRDAGGLLGTSAQRELAVTVGMDSVYGRIPAYTDPHDVDNVAKLVMDALQKAGVLRNDSRVVDMTVRKWWTAVGAEDEQVDVRLWVPA